MDADQVKDIFFKLLPVLVPLLMEGLNWVQDKWLPTAKLPGILKWVISALLGAVLASLGGLSAESIAGGASVGIAASGGYFVARGKPPQA